MKKSILNREKLFQQAKSIYVPGTCFRVKQRQTDSRDHNGKMYRYFTVLKVYDDMFLCQGEGNFRETFSAWDMYYRAEIVESGTGR